MTVFSPDLSLGSETPNNIAVYLYEIEDHAAAMAISGSGPGGQGYIFDRYVYLGTDAVYGFLEPGSTDIVPVSSVEADESLKDAKLKVTLDRFFVENYPGGGEHRILCEFAGKNQAQGVVEELRFATTCVARDQQGSSVSSLPVFLGVTAGQNGISFEGRTVNVRSSYDDTVLEVLGSETFKQGLSLLDAVQPAIRPFAKLAEGVVKMAASRNKNRQVHTFSLGLDFGSNSTSARLRCGSYIVVQSGSVYNWDWSLYKWDANTNRIVARMDSGVAPPAWNYMVFGVSRYS
ncbi:hypothetical protein ABID19_006657 [Mesorhizobium robiniae]|uniref:Uncharacterized protein n=1 Tax=Mesorhizobium robiniae TaxID=559315 RepID=A0ABV2GZL6_9HYPH|nr:hypothetical protein [Mesorhizobium sp. ZC-5]MCV3243577.1 hypothetical protein [Mesorhizobium sp. ZC-5]